MMWCMKFPRALVIDDQQHLISSLRPALERDQFEVEYVDSCHSAEQKLHTKHYDVIVLDRNLPDGDGLELLPTIREAHFDTKIVILSEKATVQYRVEGLNQGADDYIAKPFSIDEFSSRVRALMRRSMKHGKYVLTFGELQVFVKELRIEFHGTTQRFTPMMFRLFLLFLSRPQHILTRDQIAMQLWPADKYPSTSAIDVCIKRLRYMLARFPVTIVTRHNFGYELVFQIQHSH